MITATDMMCRTERVQHALQQNHRLLLLFGLLDVPGLMAVAYGLFGKLSQHAGEIHPLLADPDVNTAMLFAGAVWMILCIGSITALLVRRQRLHHQL